MENQIVRLPPVALDQDDWEIFTEVVWGNLGRVYAWHEEHRRAGYEVTFDERGTVIRHPLAVAYFDEI